MCTGQSDAILHPDVEASANQGVLEMKRLWKSIALFAIANMIAFTAPAHALEADKHEALLGVVAIGVYALHCTSDENLKARLLDQVMELTALFPAAERKAAGAEIIAMVKRVGLDEFCHMNERAAARIR
jgi:hypothetical protein